MNCFYYPQLTSADSNIVLEGDEVKHIAGARRLGVGDQLTLFNGKGVVAEVEILEILKRQLNACVINIKELKPLTPRITLASAIPKGDRINTLLDMSTQLGMSDFVPLMSERSIVNVNAKKLERFNRISINACKQCRRMFIPTIHAPTTFENLLEKHVNTDSLIVVADPHGQALSCIDRSKLDQNLILLVGPEGGFSEVELELLYEYDVLKVKLVDAILRIETACVSLLSQINYRQMC